MRRLGLLVVAVATAAGVVTVGPASAHPFAGAPGCPDLPADNWWHADIGSLPVLAQSSAYVSSMGLGTGLHPDFGSGTYDGGPIGIPFTTVSGSQPGVSVRFDDDDESDHGAYPIPADAPIEGGPAADGDRHVLVVDRDHCVDYELYDAHRNPDGSWHAGSGAIYDLRSDALRPDGWTSADAAGLPILPGLVRYDEAASGDIDHAIRVTASATQRLHLWPARHDAGSSGTSLPPMGLRLRLRPDFDVSGFPAVDQALLRAMQRYGLVVADNGSSWFVSGAPDDRWDNDALHLLGRVHGSDFQAVDTSSLQVSRDSGQVRSAQTGDQFGRYVDAVYRDFLGRPPDASGRSYWVGQLAAGLPRAAFTAVVARSPEWTRAVVANLYQWALGRGPDAGGLGYWAGRVAQGTPVTVVAAALFGSGESYADAGGTPEGFVDRLYVRILGRSPDAGGRAWWAAQLRSGVATTTLAAQLFQSEESRRARVVGLYRQLLGRAPDAGGLAYWADALLRVDDVVLAATLATSDEYVTRAQTR